MKHSFSALILIVILMLGPAFGQAPRAGVVIHDVENMYSKADDGADVVSQALLGVTVKILASAQGAEGEPWFEVQTPDTYKGWMPASGLRVYAAGEPAYASSGMVFEVTSLVALVYETPDVTEKKPRAKAPISAVLEAAGAPGERWLPVTLPCGHKGQVQLGDGALRDAGFKRPRIAPEETAALAKRFLGLPYQWGGNSPFGIDCSGFAQLLYRLSGVEILRDAGIQMTDSGLLEVPKGEEETADLVFFGRAPDRIGHVGMMISRAEFIHATTHEKPVIQISTLSDAYWMRIYQGARRAGK
ncbi:MAG: C40 family peptidase [Candidatus Aminicenantes bacterium]|nr:C40 family peptidase [Candidatus Aminicenantes bacterium]